MNIICFYRGSRSRQTYEVNDSGVAQKKFGGAKSISSDAYFGNQETDVSFIPYIAYWTLFN